MRFNCPIAGVPGEDPEGPTAEGLEEQGGHNDMLILDEKIINHDEGG